MVTTPTKRMIVLAATAVVVAGSAVAFLLNDRAQPGLLRPNDPDLVALGERVYGEACAACHGAELEGQPNWMDRPPDGPVPAPPHDESGHTWHHADELLVRITRDGMTAVAGPGYPETMPGFGDTLTDREIIAVLSYIKSTWSDEVRARHDELNRAAASRSKG